MLTLNRGFAMKKLHKLNDILADIKNILNSKDINKVDEFKDTAYNKEYRETKYKKGIEEGYF